MPAAEYALSTRCGRVGHSDILTQLALKYGTDKASHRFTRHYNMLFCKGRNDVRRVLEVGVFGGASIKMWHEYFPNATIFGVDNFAWGGRAMAPWRRCLFGIWRRCLGRLPKRVGVS